MSSGGGDSPGDASDGSGADDDNVSLGSNCSVDDSFDTFDFTDYADGNFHDIEGILPEYDDGYRFFPLYDPTENDDNREFYGDDDVDFGARATDVEGQGAPAPDARKKVDHLHQNGADTMPDQFDGFGDEEYDANYLYDADDEHANNFRRLGRGIPQDVRPGGERSIPTTQKQTRKKLTSTNAHLMKRIRALELQIQRETPEEIPGMSHNIHGGSKVTENTAQLPSTPHKGFLSSISDRLSAVFLPGPHYTVLPGPSYIRVLVIHPGKGDDSLSCTLDVVDLENPDTQYEAISYQWGRSEVSKTPLVLSGRGTYISSTLTKIFACLRLEGRSRVLWADAICINQADYAERQQQVGMMQRIYSRAHRVLICLGTSTPPDDCFKAVKALTSTWLDFQKRNSRGSGFKEPSCSIYEGATTEDIVTLFENTYWTRLWVVQEIVSSRSAVVYWGTREISWTLVGLAATLIRNNGYLWRAFNAYQKPSAASGLMNAYLMYRLPAAEFNTDSISFLDILRLTRNFDVTIPLDRIYAVLGLPSLHTGGEGQKFIEPDYRILKEGLYTRVFQRILTTHEIPLEILSAVRHQTLFYPDFPTWIPQWRRDPLRSIGGSHRKRAKFNASAGGPEKPLARVIWRLEERSLTVEGLILGKITCSRHVLPRSLSEHRRQREAQLRRHGKELGSWIQKYFPGDMEHQRRRLALTLTAGQDWYGAIVRDGPDLERHVRCFAQWARGQRWKTPLASRPQVPEPAEDIRGYAQAVRNVCRGRNMFVTNTGVLGLGPSLVAPGDVVCVVLGGPVPYVLRPLGKGLYYFVGECYVPGYMFGEAVAMWKSGRQGWQLDRFVLK